MIDNSVEMGWDVNEVTAGGERVSHLYPNDCYYAHLAVYHFALQFCQGGMVLDAGSGAGYGSAYLADHGARCVYGIDLGEIAVAFSKSQFQRSNLNYQVMDLSKITGFEEHFFDFIYSSNVLEHVPDVLAFLRVSRRLLKPDGKMLVTVPPIIRDIDWMDNIENIYHLNIWSPKQWYSVLNLYFANIQPYWQGLNKPDVPLNFVNTPEQTVINEQDFLFRPISVEEYYGPNFSLGVTFVLSKPRLEYELPSPGFKIHFIDKSFTRPFARKPEVAESKSTDTFLTRWTMILNRLRMITKYMGIGGLWQKLKLYYDRAVATLRTEGFLALLHKAIRYLKRKFLVA